MSDPLPIRTAKTEVKPFEVNVSNDDLKHLKALLRLTPIAAPTYESALPNGQRTFGVRHDWLTQAKKEWETSFDWRKYEAHINSFDHYTMQIKDPLHDFDIHFVALFSKKQDALPLLLLHGWPGSFLEFLPMLDNFRGRHSLEELPYHLIVPSLPGYAFSTAPPIDKDIQIEDVARVMNKLMINLGFGDGYVVQGGDVGSKVARVIAARHDECKAIHINFCIMEDKPESPVGEITEAEEKGLERTRKFLRTESSYAIQHATKPSTIGFVLSSNPIALLSWIGEKFLDWTDEDPPTSVILESVSLYWFSRCAATCLWPYRIFYTPGVKGNPHNMSKYKIPASKPFGYSYFPYELAPIPRAWAATTGNLSWFRRHGSGGHFAAVERTEALLKDIEDFVEESRGRAGFTVAAAAN